MTTCADLFAYFSDRASRSPGKTVSCTLASNQSNGIVGYASGLLTYLPAVTLDSNANVDLYQPMEYHSPKPEGELQQYFSDRQRGDHPFDTTRIDRIKVSIAPEIPPPADRLRVSITLLMWENTTFSFLVECAGDVLFGFGDPVGHQVSQAFYTLALH